MANDIIFGKNSVMEALIAGDREINKILISKIFIAITNLTKSKNWLEKEELFFNLLQKKNSNLMQNITIKGLSLKSPPSNIWIWMIF